LTRSPLDSDTETPLLTITLTNFDVSNGQAYDAKAWKELEELSEKQISVAN
jgi:hypothetical protein